MSTDSIKDDASVVDSSVTQKHDARNLDDPENCSYRANGNFYHSTAEVPHPDENLVESSCAGKMSKKYDTRYFIIKSLNHCNLQLSVEKGIWATQVMNEPILEDAYNHSGRVILIFSVNMSGSFQGYAQMMSTVGWRRDNVWNQGAGGNNPWGRSFKVKWLQLNNLPFHRTLHLKNPLNDFKPVKISRDCQELPPEIGEALCELIDKEIDGSDSLQRADFHARWQNEEYKGHAVNMSWARSPQLYPPLLYQNHAEARKVDDLRVDPQASGFDSWVRPSEISPISSNISEDEFLEMSYEEYLEAHSGSSSKRLCYPAVGPSRRKHDTSTEECVDDMQAQSDHEHSHKKTRRTED
ncbi:hypothetical protein Dimus_008815 [Dionaea muscipula]